MADRWYVVSTNNLGLSPDCFRDAKGKPVSRERWDFWTSTPDAADSYASYDAAFAAIKKYRIPLKLCSPKPVSKYVPDPRRTYRTASLSYVPLESAPPPAVRG